jgi:outer membrane protein assembly factor BamB
MAAGQTKLLVLMNTSGTVECYDMATGAHQGTLIKGLSKPAGMALGTDGNLYISDGGAGRTGCVKRYELKTGRYLDVFVLPAKEGTPGRFAAGAGLLFYDGDLYVAGYGQGQILRFDGKTGAYINMAAQVEPYDVGMQFAINDGKIFVPDFKGHAVKCFGLSTGKLVEQMNAPRGVFGVVFIGGKLFFSVDNNQVHRWEGTDSTVVADLSDGAFVARYLAAGPDGKIYIPTANDNVVVADANRTNKNSPVRIIRGGAEMRGPTQIIFTDQAMTFLPQSPKLLIMPGSDEVVVVEPTAGVAKKSVFKVAGDAESASLPVMSWDTEGGKQASTNLLYAPVRLDVLKSGGTVQMTAKAEKSSSDSLDYTLSYKDMAVISWRVRLAQGCLQMTISGQGKGVSELDALEMTFPFDPLATATTVLAEDWDAADTAGLPFVISSPDFGQLYVTCKQYPHIRANFSGDRINRWIDLVFRLPVPKEGESYTLDFSPLVLPTPKGLSDAARWEKNRRAWFGLLQMNARWGYRDESWGNRAGIWANNVISDSVSSVMYMLADHALLVPELAPGVRVAPMVRRTVDFWLDTKMTPEGEIFYYERRDGSMDANPSTLIGAWAYVEASGDMEWLQRRIGVLEFVASYTDGRDVDGDGLIESCQSGNSGTFTFGDTAWDCFCSGHKNALVNLLTYRAWCCMADLQGRLGRPEKKAYYLRRATQIKENFEKTFYNPLTGWLGWWRSRDGQLHDMNSDVITGMAVMYGVISPERGSEMLERYWLELEKAGFRRFDLGLPLTIKPVPWQDYHLYQTPDGTTKNWQKYLNGGCWASNTYFSLVAMYMGGQVERADGILNAMLKRQNDGVFPNGGGFQNGIVFRADEGAESMDWEGKPNGYEGYLIYSYSFAQALLQREEVFRQLIYRPMIEAQKQTRKIEKD